MTATASVGKLAVGVVVAIAVCGLAASGAAAPREVPGRARSEGVQRPDPMVRRTQELLLELAEYQGPADGVHGPQSRAALRSYLRRAGLPETTSIGEPLIRQLESAVAVEQLLRRLEQAREEGAAAAREALLGSAATRDLVGGRSEVADPTRNPTACFAQPNPVCVLAEAVESAKALSVEERRDWAFGEILVAQARAGLIAEARASARRMSDARLIMVALQDIALAQARRLRNADAVAAAATIPDSSQRIETLAEMALLQAAAAPGDAVANARQAGVAAAAMQDPARAAALMTRAALAMARAGDVDAAAAILASAKERLEPGRSLGPVAAAYAEIGRIDDALALLEHLASAEDRTPVLVAIAAAQAEAGQAAEALNTAQAIAETRFRAPALARVAEILARKGNADGARAAAEAAIGALETATPAYARDATLATIVRLSPTLDRQPDWALAERIADPKVRAESLWAVAAVLATRADAAAADEARNRAREATALVPVTLTRVWLLCEAAETRARQGAGKDAWQLWHEALDQAAPVGNAWVRARALARLGHALVAMEEASRNGAR